MCYIFKGTVHPIAMNGDKSACVAFCLELL